MEGGMERRRVAGRDEGRMEGRRDGGRREAAEERCGGEGRSAGGAVGWRTAPSCGTAAAWPQGQGQRQPRAGGLQCRAAAASGPRPRSAPSRERPLLLCPWVGTSQPASPCLSFPHHSTLHPIWPRETRAAQHGWGQHPTTNTRHPAALGASPKASCEQSWCVPTARGWGQA